MITYIEKDKVLKCLCESIQPESHYNLNTEVIKESANVTFEDLNSILTYFQRNGLIMDLNCRKDSLFLTLTIEAVDLFNRGGFLAHEEIFEKNIEKLLLEMENLSKQLTPNHLETANKISAIGSAILTGLGLLKN